ncbi:MAG: hypothetical protein LUC85_09875, partial [Bacteroidales bacterium]|nr:hypothetical protein [Bacteroidales bacterium]
MMIEFKHIATAIALATVASGVTSAYASTLDDDIYFSSKPKKETKTTAKSTTTSTTTQYTPQSAVATTATSTMRNSTYAEDRDVDEYNRRYTDTDEYTDSIASLDDASNDFTYTNRIERFYNPDIVQGSNDADLQDYYYTALEDQAETSVTNINLYVVPSYVGYWDNFWSCRTYWDGWWGPSWSLTWTPGWGWSYGWGVGVFPALSWSWGYGWGPSWGWGCGWGPRPWG